MPGAPLTETELNKIVLLHGDGWSATRIAKEIGRSTSSVTRAAAKLGKTFDHEKTANATKAAAIDIAARRAQISARLLDEATEVLDALKKPYFEHTFTQAGQFVRHAVTPRPQEKLHLVRAAASLLAEHRHLAEHDAVKEESGMADVDQWLDAMTAGAGH
jgi:hypothetical protein